MSPSRDRLLAGFLGNDVQKQTLIGLTNGGRLCHALLLTGPHGCGKRTFARLAAAAMLCEGIEHPCGECVHCRKVMAGVHPDVITLDCADTEHDGHKIETLHTKVLDTVAVAPNEAARKVYILANLESMSYGTPNALLKTLEEPPEHAAFILTAASRELLLDTILSRVVCIPLQPLDDEVLLRELAGRCPDAARDDLREAADASFGCLGEALETLSNPSQLELARRVRRALEALAARDEYALLAALTLPDKNRDSLRVLLRMLLLSSREALACRVSGKGHGMGAALAEKRTAKAWSDTVALCERASDMLARNVSRALIPAWLASRLSASV